MGKKRHTVKIEDIITAPLIRKQLAASYGGGESKSLEVVVNCVTMDAWYEVVVDKGEPLIAMKLRYAIEIYNDS